MIITKEILKQMIENKVIGQTLYATKKEYLEAKKKKYNNRLTNTI